MRHIPSAPPHTQCTLYLAFSTSSGVTMPTSWLFCVVVPSNSTPLMLGCRETTSHQHARYDVTHAHTPTTAHLHAQRSTDERHDAVGELVALHRHVTGAVEQEVACA
jgi:hypothetical protein